ncbi:methyltransferase family protein [Limimaricola soesokkakensis]|uniref:Malonyl-[acyl-carrier protein] O-methyltransferase n=1 Tax=Limimaricola soesokkakensis TaxID=1343159 RepID=A0A1X6YD29_9RHOB|nr:class I SAM-dependent methyltransferase [Limimaricola soesokkakensis]PSK87017.1 methyltransferase family protein [Limimaricola soesokkakensis]SLN17741.1 Malonyl-[acyl-carrier protein] O-methyltransferase [Limimaricola soesokkakensis]
MDGIVARAEAEAYELFMGRWSRPVADRFLDWLKAPTGGDWIDIGAGTGVLTAAILERSAPRHLLAVEGSESFVAHLHHRFSDARLSIERGDALQLPLPAESRDVAVSGLFVNFATSMEAALAEMRRVLRPGGLLGFYVWDYPSGGMGMLDAFWQAAMSVDPEAERSSERHRFAKCDFAGLDRACRAVGLEPAIGQIDTMSEHEDFEAYWRPFTQAPSTAKRYLDGLDPDARARLRGALAQRLDHGGPIRLPARAWCVKAQLPDK